MEIEELKQKITIQNALDFLCDACCDACNHNICDNMNNQKVCNEEALERLRERGWFGGSYVKQAQKIYERMIATNASSITSSAAKTMMNAIEHLQNEVRELENG